MLSRMLQCRNCGETLTVRPSKRQTSHYYQCRTRRFDGVEVCNCPNLNTLEMDERVLRVVLDDILCPSNVQIAIAKMSEELTKPYEDQHAVLQAIESELTDLDQRQARIMEAFEAGAYTVDDYSRRITPLRATEADLRKKMAEAEQDLDHQTAVLAKPEEILQFVSQLSDFLKNSSPKDRKQMLNRFIKCIWIEPGKGTVVYRIPLPKDAKRPHATNLVLALDEPVPPTVRLTPQARGFPGLIYPPPPTDTKSAIQTLTCQHVVNIFQGPIQLGRPHSRHLLRRGQQMPIGIGRHLYRAVAQPVPGSP